MFRTLLTSLVFLSVVCHARAQVVSQERGPFAGAPLGVSVDNLSVLNSADLLVKPTGEQTSAPAEVPPIGNGPDLRRSAVFAGAGAIDVNAMSSGNDWVTMPVPGKIVPPPNGWVAMTFSVSRNTLGAQGSFLAQHASTTANLGGDLLSHFFSGSAAIPQSLIETPVWLEQLSSEMGIPNATELDADDYALSLRNIDPTFLETVGIKFDELYFSVSNGTVNAVPTTWWSRGGQSETPSAATILVAKWDETIPGWSTPEVFKTYEELGLQQSDDVDALAVDHRNRQAPATFIYSTVYTQSDPNRSQLLYAHHDTQGYSARPVTDDMGILLHDQLGMRAIPANQPPPSQGDDIDGVCLVDPGNHVPGRVWGPTDLPYGQVDSLGLGVWHSAPSALVTTVTGWPTPVDPSPQGTLEYFVYVNNDFSTLTSIYVEWIPDGVDSVEHEWFLQPWVFAYSSIGFVVAFRSATSPGSVSTTYAFSTDL